MSTNSHVQFDDEEDTTAPLQRATPTGETFNAQLCLVGRFLTRKPIRTLIMKDCLAAIWQPERGVNIRVLYNNLFLFQFYHWRDVKKVTEGGPWLFDGHMLVLSQLGVGDVPTQVSLFHITFWVQVHDIPIGFMTEAVGRVLGNFIGQFLEYDPKNSSDFWKSFMRIRVSVDVRRPLRRGKKINVGGDNIKVVRFKYERLSVFYYLCGALGHLDTCCDLLFDMEHDDGSRGWGPDLKVERRVPGDNNVWLRQERSGGQEEGHGGRPVRGGQGEGTRNNDGIHCAEQFQTLYVHNGPIMMNAND